MTGRHAINHRAVGLELAICAGSVATYCDHAEHNEPVQSSWVIGAGQRMRGLALAVGVDAGLDIVGLYAQRLAHIESANVRFGPGSFDGATAARTAGTWRELQLVQLEHDQVYHSDVVGLSRAAQLHHYAFHLAKLSGAFARRAAGEADDDEVVVRRLPDILLFGIKLATVMAERLADEPLPRSVDAAPEGERRTQRLE